MQSVAQGSLFENSFQKFPSTRYQGSKVKLIDWIWDNVKHISFNMALDAFGGTGAVAYCFKQKEKRVLYNDISKFNYLIGKALIENKNVHLEKNDLDFLLTKHPDINYPTFIQDTFKDIFFTDDENKWLDILTANINLIDNEYKKALAYFALFQSCIIKRPFNLFHRKNLYIRLANVKRNFGNKTTWDKPFEKHFIDFVNEANNAVFDNGQDNTALNRNVFDLDTNFDLVYIDTPYINKNGIGVDYLDFYHFLEGITHYNNWKNKIDYKSKHRRLKLKKSEWCDKYRIHKAYNRLFDKFRDSILVVSYRSDGIPSEEELVDLLKIYKKDVVLIHFGTYKYVLSRNDESREILLIGQ